MPSNAVKKNFFGNFLKNERNSLALPPLSFFYF